MSAKNLQDVWAKSVASLEEVVLLAKSHVSAYTRSDGTFVAEHDDKRQAKQHHEMTPKQYHVNKLVGMAKEYDISHSEVKEMYDDDAGRKANEQEWVNHVKDAFKTGKPLSSRTLDNLEKVRPGAVASFRHDHPEAKIPDGYQIPSARKHESEEKQARLANKREILVEHGKGKKKTVEQKPLHSNESAPVNNPSRDESWRDEDNWHSRTIKRMASLSESELNYIVKDANEAAKNAEEMGNPKAGQYRDEAHYASMELKKRKDSVPKK